MLDLMPNDQRKDFIRTQMIIVKVYTLWIILIGLIYQVPNSYLYIKSGQLSLICLIVVQFTFTIGILGTMIFSVRMDKPEINKIVACLVLLRQYLPMFDIENRRHSDTELSNSIFIVGKCVGLIIKQITNNLVLDKKIAFI